MERTINGKHLMETHWSLGEFADYSAKHAGDKRAKRYATLDFANVGSFDEALNLAKHGWSEQLPAAMAIAESAIEMASKEHMTDTFNPVWDVSGAEVDVARYLSGEPECMIDFPLSKTSKQGRVITLVASLSTSAAVEADTMIRRGQVIVALALALSRLGHSVEIWADCSTSRHSVTACERVLIKGVNDEIDAAQLMFALAHPAMLRCLAFGAKDGFPDEWGKELGYSGYGRPAPRTKADIAQYPEGTIFLPELRSYSDVPNADQFLRKYLGELGLLAE